MNEPISPTVRRPTARHVILSDEGRVLLFSVEDPNGAHSDDPLDLARRGRF